VLFGIEQKFVCKINFIEFFKRCKVLAPFAKLVLSGLSSHGPTKLLNGILVRDLTDQASKNYYAKLSLFFLYFLDIKIVSRIIFILSN
jgi:hypothetical protein